MCYFNLRRRLSNISSRSEDRTSVPLPSPPLMIARPLSFDGEASSIGNSSAMEEVDSLPATAPPHESNANAGFRPPALLRLVDAKKPNAPKGVFSGAEGPRGLFGLKVPSFGEVTKLTTLEKLSLRQLAPDHTIGVDPRSVKAAKKQTLPFKAAKLFNEKPTLFFCIRCPG